MIKNIIFDLDNTIIEYKDEYALYYKDALKNCGYNESNYLNIYNSLDDYQSSLNDKNRFYSKKDAIEFLNKNLNTNYDIKLIDELNKVIGKNWTKSIFLHESTLKYLASKYNLYVFTNWFTSAQTERLKNIGYLKYFTKVFGSDIVGAKPFTSSFCDLLNSINALPNECIMVGDSKEFDICGANSAGIHAILFDFNGKRDNKNFSATDYSIITDINELKTIL